MILLTFAFFVATILFMLILLINGGIGAAHTAFPTSKILLICIFEVKVAHDAVRTLIALQLETTLMVLEQSYRGISWVGLISDDRRVVPSFVYHLDHGLGWSAAFLLLGENDERADTPTWSILLRVLILLHVSG